MSEIIIQEDKSVLILTEVNNQLIIQEQNQVLVLQDQGVQGVAGVGVPAGGTTGQALTKNSNTNYDTEWTTIDKAFVGLGNVDNTSDLNKPISTATQTALNAKQPTGNYITALTGDVTASGPGSATATLANSGVTAGSYVITGATVDAKGRVTSATDNYYLTIVNALIFG
jgi:hypothetical protein